MNHEILSPRSATPSTRPNVRLALLLGLAALSWLIAYNLIQPLANWLTYVLLGLPAGSHLGESVAFFLYDVPKILLLLGGMIYPRASMPFIPRMIGNILPMTYFVRLSRGIFTKGVGIRFLWSDMLALALYMLIITLVAARNFKKRLD